MHLARGAGRGPALLGGSGLLLLGDLAEAVNRESAAAIMHWWGASEGAVWRWRKSLGVTRTNNDGSRRLIRAGAGEGGAAFRERGLTAEEVEQRRRRAVVLDLARHLPPGCHVAPAWGRGR